MFEDFQQMSSHKYKNKCVLESPMPLFYVVILDKTRGISDLKVSEYQKLYNDF